MACSPARADASGLVSQNITSALQQAQAVPSTFNSGHGGAGYEAIGRVSAILQGIDAVQSLTNPSVSASLTLGGSGSFSTAQAYSTSVKPSVLSAGTDITLVAGRDVHVQASQIQAGGALSVTAGRDLTLESAPAVTQASQSSSSFSAGIGVGGSCSATQGCSGGVTGQAAGALSTAERQSVTQVNTQLKAGGALALKADNDTVIAGALVTGQTLRIDAGRDLLITSRQDTARSSNQSVNASASLTIGAGVSGSVGVGGATGQSDKAWVTQQTQVVANDRLEVSTKGHTQLGGAVINSKTGNLSVETGTLGVTTIKDHDRGSQTGVQVSVSGSLQSGDSQGSQGSQASSSPQPSGAQPQSPQKQSTSASVSGTVQNYDRAQDTRGTIGAGSITIRDPSKSDITQLNRDVTQSQVITKDTSSGVKFYASSEAVKEVLSGGAGIKENILASAKILTRLDETVSNAILLGKSMGTVFGLALTQVQEPELAQAIAAGDISPRDALTQLQSGACAQKEGFNLHDLIFTRAFAASCILKTVSGKEISIGNAQNCADALVSSLTGQLLVLANAGAFGEGLKKGLIHQGQEFYDMASNPLAVANALNGLAAQLLVDPQGTAKLLGVTIAGNAQETVYNYLDALARGDYQAAGQYAADMLVQVGLVVLPGQAAGIAVKTTERVEKLLAVLNTAKAERALIFAATSTSLETLPSLFSKSETLNTLTVGGKAFEIVSENKWGNVLVLESQVLSDAEILAYAQKLAGGALEQKAPFVWTKELADGTIINLRSISSSVESTGARWNIDIINNPALTALNMTNKRFALKFR